MSKILVVDDEPTMLAAFEEILGGLEHEVVTARRAETAIEQLQVRPVRSGDPRCPPARHERIGGAPAHQTGAPEGPHHRHDRAWHDEHCH